MSTEEEPKGNIATRSFNRLKGKYEELDPEVRKLLGTGLGGAALGGGLGFLLTGDRRGESDSARRKRILMNSLLGAGLGGVAGAGIPFGLKQLQAASKKDDMDKLQDAFVDNLPPALATGGGAVGGAYLSKGLNNLLFGGGDNPIDLRTPGKGGMDEAFRMMRSNPRTGSRDVASRAGMLPGFAGLLRSKAVKTRMSEKGFKEGISNLNSINRLLKGTAGAGLAGLGGLAGYGAYNTLV